MKHEDKLQYIRKTIKCLELVEERLRHRPEDKELVAEIKQVNKNLRGLLRDARKKTGLQQTADTSLMLLKALSMLKFLHQLFSDIFSGLF